MDLVVLEVVLVVLELVPSSEIFGVKWNEIFGVRSPLMRGADSQTTKLDKKMETWKKTLKKMKLAFQIQKQRAAATEGNSERIQKT